ncbi:MAG: DUF3943 domain-containing protein [Gemmatimonadales bacterium]
MLALLVAVQVDTVPPPRTLLAVGQTTAINVLINRLDWWARRRSWANVGTRVWGNNVRLGWEWDEDAFPTNVFAHPYHGGVYFNTARSNGLDFFQSIPVTLFGAWTWEYFGETERPSLNDFLMTTFGGVAMGEISHRVGATIRDNGARGAKRTFRELAALPLDPVGSLNRLLRGEWKGTGRNPAEHDPAAYVFLLGAGARFAKGLMRDSIASMGAIVVDLLYGDQFAGEYKQPFDVFNVRLIMSSHTGLNAFRASGRLYGRALNDSTARFRHVLAVNQRYDYVNNPAQKVGGQSVEIGINSRWRLGKGGYGIRTSLFVDGIILGAIDAPHVGVGLRDYDFGPGGGVRWEAALDRKGERFFLLYGRVEYIHGVSGASADHVINFSGAEVTVPITNHFGLSAQTYIFDRDSHYSDRAPDKRDFPEGRILLVWTKARAPRSLAK